MDEEYSSFVSSDGEGNKNAENECARNDILPTLDTTLDSIWPSKEKGSSEVPKSNNLRCGFGEEESSTVFNDVSGDSSVAVHAAEKVLDSPSSQEDSTEEGKLRPETRLDVPTMIKAIHNLSELLLFHLSKDSCDIDEQYIETLKQTRDNLDSCLSKKIVKTAIEPEPNNPVGDAAKKFGELHVSPILGSPHTTNEEKKNCSTSKKKNCSTSEKKDEKSRVSSPLVDDLDTTTDDDMAKAIKKVLDENFNFDEEMHSQTLLFKNLWLEAEAKLCSVSYKARFDRMKIEMEKSKPKSPKANEDVAQMMTKIHFSPDLSKLTPKAHDVTIPEPSIPTTSFSSMTGHASDTAEASVMARFNILKSREDNLILKPMNVREEHEQEQPENLDGDSVSSVMSRFNALISREEKLKSINVEEQQQQQQPPPETSLKDESEDEILGKYGSNPDGFGPFGYESGTNDSTVVHSLDHIKIINQCLKDESEDEILGKYGSNSDGFGPFGYESVPNDSTVVHSFDHVKIINQYYAGGRDSSSSDWEHVLKDDFAWKNFLA
ncbi:hypothetical protein ACJIZ3_003458 [Penstemon smallii]|uniref:Uncharacterized protein n=1 Tax=Penstemon smallii TaxID=265156 RepID=A0ABD3UCD4_9LAMI